MKNLLSIILCTAGSVIFLSCQKSHELSAPQQQEELLTATSTGTVATEVVSNCGQFRTQSQGGWGVNPVGENPGTYLHDHFASVYPSGITIGCTNGSGYSVTFTSAAAITQFLPAGGTAMVLSANALDPAAKSIQNVLIGQVTALALNLAFDYSDPNFAPAEENLGNMVISSGQFAGLSVIQFLGLANSVLGGCSLQNSAADINQTATLINANFIDGKIDSGFLSCPTARFER